MVKELISSKHPTNGQLFDNWQSWHQKPKTWFSWPVPHIQ
jgi:hypothetical protein